MNLINKISNNKMPKTDLQSFRVVSYFDFWRELDMSLIQCDNCGCVENTACTMMTAKWTPNDYDWTGIEDRKGMKLCCICLPTKYSDGTEVERAGKWHGRFDRVFLEKGKWKTNNVGNLENIETGDTNYSKYILAKT